MEEVEKYKNRCSNLVESNFLLKIIFLLLFNCEGGEAHKSKN